MTGLIIFHVTQGVRVGVSTAYWEDASALQDKFDMALGHALPPAAVSIEKRLTVCELWATHLTESLEHGVLHAFYCDGALTKLEATDYMETGKYRVRFYCDSGHLIYACDAEVRYEMPDGTLESMRPGKCVSVQTREQLMDGKAIGQMDESQPCAIASPVRGRSFVAGTVREDALPQRRMEPPLSADVERACDCTASWEAAHAKYGRPRLLQLSSVRS
jgi:hypothetical protein